MAVQIITDNPCRFPNPALPGRAKETALSPIAPGCHILTTGISSTVHCMCVLRKPFKFHQNLGTLLYNVGGLEV